MRIKRPTKLFRLLIALFMISGMLPASAQQFAWQAALPAIPDSGFYNIPLSPALVAKSNGTGLKDLRIFDQQTAISYILQTDSNYIRIPDPVITVVKEASPKETVLQLQFPDEYLIQQLTFNIANPAFYRRVAYVTEDISAGGYRHGQFTLIAGQPATFRLSTPLKTRQCYIVIENEDNPPLKLAGITCWQKQYHLTAWLEKGKEYVVRTGSPELPAPVYDLPYFTGKLPADIPALVTGNIMPIKAVITKKPAPAPATVFKSKGWIWAGIGAIILLMSLLTIRLLRDMRERK